MGWVEAYITHTENGYPSRRDTYQAKNCQECHLQEKCCKSDANRCVEINHALRNYKKQVRELLASQEGKQLYRQRSIEPESVFGQMKANMHYKRFRHFGKDKITMDFAIFAIAFNIGKMWNVGQKSKKKDTNNIDFSLIWFVWVRISIQQLRKLETKPTILINGTTKLVA
jgi:hypothetical protein